MERWSGGYLRRPIAVESGPQGVFSCLGLQTAAFVGQGVPITWPSPEGEPSELVDVARSPQVNVKLELSGARLSGKYSLFHRQCDFERMGPSHSRMAAAGARLLVRLNMKVCKQIVALVRQEAFHAQGQR